MTHSRIHILHQHQWYLHPSPKEKAHRVALAGAVRLCAVSAQIPAKRACWAHRVFRPLTDHIWNLRNINTIIRYACINCIRKLTCEGPHQELPLWECLVSLLGDFNSRGSLSSHPVSRLHPPLEAHLCAPQTPAINFTREINSVQNTWLSEGAARLLHLGLNGVAPQVSPTV